VTDVLAGLLLLRRSQFARETSILSEVRWLSLVR